MSSSAKKTIKWYLLHVWGEEGMYKGEEGGEGEGEGEGEARGRGRGKEKGNGNGKGCHSSGVSDVIASMVVTS